MKNTNKTRKKATKSKIVICCLDFLNNLKLFHWSTYSYSEHMASDELYITLTKKIDKLIESFLQTRIPIKTTITINTNKLSFLKKMKEFRELMKTIDVSYELLSLRDDILIAIDQFEYRLTFKN